VLTNIILVICDILPKIQLKTVNSFITQMSSDNQLCLRKHASIMFRSSDERVLLTIVVHTEQQTSCTSVHLLVKGENVEIDSSLKNVELSK